MKYTRMVGGIPTTIDDSVSSYQESYIVSSPISINDHITLPNSKTYDGTKDELVVNHNGIWWVEGVEYQYQNSASATYIVALIALPSGGRINFYKAI